jgi:hypothetical protein
MKVIDTWEEMKQLASELKELRNEKRIDRFLFNGTLHEGHYEFVKQIRSGCDILVGQYNEFYNFLSAVLWKPEKTDLYNRRKFYEDIIMTAFPVREHFDYIVINKLPPEDILNRIYTRILKYFPPIKEEVKRLNLPFIVAVECMYTNVPDPIQKVINIDKMGPKCFIPRVLHKKLFPEEYVESSLHSEHDAFKYTFFKMFLNEKGEAYSRTKGNVAFLRPKAVKLFNEGVRDFKSFQDVIMFGNFIMDPKFTILDYKTLEKIDKVTDDCVIVYGDIFTAETIFIVDGKII